MSDPLRKIILDELKANFESLNNTSSLWGPNTTVERAARGFADLEVRPETMPFIGIIPQEDTVSEYPDHIEVDWPIEIVGHIEVDPRTEQQVVDTCTQMRTDMRRIIYTYQDLSETLGVMNVSLRAMMGSEGAPRAAEDGIASVFMRIAVEFMEGILD